MGFIPIIALCTLLATEQPNMEQCVFVDDQTHAFSSETGCAIQANRIKDDPAILQESTNMLFAQYGYIGRQGYKLWCIPSKDVKDFYNRHGVGDLDDIPYDI